MRREEKVEVMSYTDSDLNKAKDLMARSAEKLEEKGLHRDAVRLMNMVYNLEAFQNKYRGSNDKH